MNLGFYEVLCPYSGKVRKMRRIPKASKDIPRIKALHNEIKATEDKAKKTYKEAKEKKAEGGKLYEKALKIAIELGTLLIEEKEKHKGTWIPYVKNILELNERTAQRYMNVAGNVGLIVEAKSIRQANRMINDWKEQQKTKKKAEEAREKAEKDKEEEGAWNGLEAEGADGEPDDESGDEPDGEPAPEPKVQIVVKDDSITGKELAEELFKVENLSTEILKELAETLKNMTEDPVTESNR